MTDHIQNGLVSAATDQALTHSESSQKQANKIMPPIISAGGAPYGSVIKLQWLRAIAGRSDLGRVTLAACAIIADMADSKTGTCWPSFSYLAKASGTSARHIKTCISQAIDCNLVTIAERGNRVRSNRYQINLDIIGGELQNTTGSDPQDTTGSDTQDTRVVICSSEGSDPQVQDVVIHRSPESIHLSEQQAKDRWDGSQAEGGARSLRANRPSLSRHGEEYLEFWEAVGKRSTVHQSEQLIREYIADGVEYADIVNGAKRWRAYNEVTGGKNAASPLNWLKQNKWKDDWKLKDSKPKSKVKGEPNQQQRGKSIKAKKTKNPDFTYWMKRRDQAQINLDASSQSLDKHLRSCRVCKEAIDSKDLDNVCAESKDLARLARSDMENFNKWQKENRPPERWLYEVT